ncbi:hypothetical protein CEXT_347421, partial [Caerostris extrusa]
EVDGGFLNISSLGLVFGAPPSPSPSFGPPYVFEGSADDIRACQGSIVISKYKFTSYSASLLAASCLAVAINGITWLRKPWGSLSALLESLTELTDINMKYLQACITDVEDLIATNIAQLKQVMPKTMPSTNKLNCSMTANGIQNQLETSKDARCNI